MARVYLKDISSRSLRTIFDRFPGAIHSPSLIAAEITSAWLAKVPAELAWDDYEDFLAQFTADVSQPTQRVQLWSIDELVLQTQQMIRESIELHIADQQTPRIHAHDAYYISLARWLQSRGSRVVLVTNDRQMWLVARALGIEAFHGNTCDLGIGQLNVGHVGTDFPENTACQPCSMKTCPSGFNVDLENLPVNLGSGTPRTRPEIEGTKAGQA